MKTKKNTKSKLLKSKNRKSLKHKLQKGGAEAYVPPNDSNIKKTFSRIKNNKIWIPPQDLKKNSNAHFYDWTDPKYGDNKVSVSGTGSVDWYLKYYIEFMKLFFDNYKIRSVVDIGCGDFLMGPRLYAGKTINYTGYDIVHSNIIDNNKKLSIQYKNLPIYQTKRDPLKNMSFEFIESDFTKEEDRETLKPADLCIIKDVLQHLNDARIIESVNALIKSNKYKYILICNNYIEGEIVKSKPAQYPEIDSKGCYKKYEYNQKGKILQLDNQRINIESGHMARPLSAIRFPLDRLFIKPEILYCFRSKEISLITVPGIIHKQNICNFFK